MSATYKVTIFNGNIISLIQVGDGARWIRSEAKQVETVARRIAPKRTGRLAASHVTLPTRGSNQYQKVYRISALAPYAIYPHEGTGIYGPKHQVINIGKRMGPLPGAYNRLTGEGRGPGATVRRSRRPRYIRTSKGQPAKRWLVRAAEIALG